MSAWSMVQCICIMGHTGTFRAIPITDGMVTTLHTFCLFTILSFNENFSEVAELVQITDAAAGAGM